MSELSRQEALFERLESGDLDHVRSMLESFHPSEIADLLESLPGRSRRVLWELVDREVEGDVLSDVQDAVRAGLLEQMQPQEVADVTKDLDTDDAADILQDSAGRTGPAAYCSPWTRKTGNGLRRCCLTRKTRLAA